MTVFLRNSELFALARAGIRPTASDKLRSCRTRAEFDAYMSNPKRDWDDDCARFAAEMQREGFPE